MKLFHRVRWHGVRMAQGMGVPGLSGLALAGCVAAFSLAVIAPLLDEVEGVRQAVERLRARAAAPSPAAATTEDPMAQLEMFYRFFPARDSLPELLQTLYREAERHNLALDEGEYRFVADRGRRLARYELLLPVRGNYVQLRRFLAETMRDVPRIVLNSVTLNRQKPSEDTVDARLSFTIYLAE
ncbi:MAG: type 4a pilus biogenesis protein PilO [Pseudomonadota bacterium]